VTDYGTLDDEKLVEMCRQGDERALETLLERYRKYYLGKSFEWAVWRDDVEDAVQEAVLKLRKKINRYDPSRGAFSTYAYCIGESAFKDYYRQQTRTYRLADDGLAWEIVEDTEPSPEPGPEDIVFQHTVVTEALAQLDPGDCELLIEHHVYGIPQGILGADRGITRNAVAQRIHRTREKLRAILAEMDVAEEDLLPHR
jgi:RNA polymerase sigma factor (sigma-70 family)